MATQSNQYQSNQNQSNQSNPSGKSNERSGGEKGKQGFASMDPAKQKEIAGMGGKASHENDKESGGRSNRGGSTSQSGSR